MALLMKTILATVFAVLLTALPLAADPPHDVRSWAREAGLPNSFELLYEEGDFQAYFTTGGVACLMGPFLCMEYPPHIYVSAPKEWPREFLLFLLYHEIGHYHQVRLGLHTGEWNADEFAVRLLCDQGLNGPELAAGALSSITPLVNLDSPAHGNHYQRIDNVRSMRCGGLEKHGPQA